MLREHRDRETDQTEALKAKDSQVCNHYTKLFLLAKSFISYFALPECIAEHIAHWVSMLLERIRKWWLLMDFIYAVNINESSSYLLESSTDVIIIIDM